MSYRALLPTAAFLLTMTAEPSLAQAPERNGGEARLVAVERADLQWNSMTPKGFDKGMQMAVVHGDPAESGEPYVVRLRFPDGYRFPPHWHPVPENVTVLSGTFMLGMGEKVEESRVRRYQPGDYLYIEPKHPHFGGARGETVIQLHGPGPFEIVVVGSPEDRQRESAAAR